MFGGCIRDKLIERSNIKDWTQSDSLESTGRRLAFVLSHVDEMFVEFYGWWQVILTRFRWISSIFLLIIMSAFGKVDGTIYSSF